MPAVARTDFSLALNQVCAERGIKPEDVIEVVADAILAAYRKENPGVNLEEYRAEVNQNTGEAHIFKGDEDVTPPGFGRIAAQTAKQVILQKVREVEKATVISDFTQKIGTLVNGMILRFDGPNVIVDIGKIEAVMPPHEQIQNENYRLNQRLVFYIEGVRESHRGHEVVVSRAHKNLVGELFKREVPELQNNAVEIRAIAREAGGRTKIAVASTQSGVDPVGACVGQKGVRVQAVINETGGYEKIDVIQWSDDMPKFIAAALAPAKDVEVSWNQELRIAVAVIADDQLSLAIGREGQNVRLAAKLTESKIDIKGKSEPAATSQNRAAQDDKSDRKDKEDEDKGKTKKEKTAKKAKKMVKKEKA